MCAMIDDSKDKFSIKFRGVRGSHPVSSPGTIKYGGNTSCIEVNVDNHLLIIDAGTGVIELGNELVKKYISSGSSEYNRKPIEAVMLFSHAHQDHIQGFPFFKPAYINSSNIYMYGAKQLGMSFQETLSKSMFTPFFPVDLGEMAANLLINDFRETEVLLLYRDQVQPDIVRLSEFNESELPPNTVIVRCIKSYAHPKDGVLMFKITWNGFSFVYASDKESYIGSDSRLVSFARNTNLLIHDAQYAHDDYVSPVTPKQGYGHSTPEMAVETAKLANAKNLILFHIDPSYDDNFIQNLEQSIKKQFNNCIYGYEGLEIELV